MKKTLKNNLVFAVLFIGLFSFANDKTLLEGSSKTKESYVTFSNVKIGSILRLKDASDEIIYKETITVSGQYLKKFDFTFLPTGNYYFELEKDIEITTKTFSVNVNSISLNNEKETKFYKPIVTKKGPRLFISQLALNQEPLNLKLYYENGMGDYSVIYTQTLKDDIILESILKLSEKRKGIYKLFLYSGDHVFEKTFNLD